MGVGKCDSGIFSWKWVPISQAVEVGHLSATWAAWTEVSTPYSSIYALEPESPVKIPAFGTETNSNN
jgi:hypothetical protein